VETVAVGREEGIADDGEEERRETRAHDFLGSLATPSGPYLFSEVEEPDGHRLTPAASSRNTLAGRSC
jgi:hypothetical protein